VNPYPLGLGFQLVGSAVLGFAAGLLWRSAAGPWWAPLATEALAVAGAVAEALNEERKAKRRPR
jgi:hypothetical protein